MPPPPPSRSREPAGPARIELRARLADLSEWLPAADRALMKATCADGKPAAELAVMLQVSPQSRRRRLRRLARRMQTPEFAFAAHGRSRLDPLGAAVAGLCILEGLSERAAAKTLGVSIYAVRRTRLAITTMACAAASSRDPQGESQFSPQRHREH